MIRKAALLDVVFDKTGRLSGSSHNVLHCGSSSMGKDRSPAKGSPTGYIEYCAVPKKLPGRGGQPMPLVKISLLKGRSSDYRKAILDGVHSALVTAFRIPDSDRHQQIYELDEEKFEKPQAKSDRFVVIEIIAFQGRSLEAKRKLYGAIVQNLGESPGIVGDDILIILHESTKENWCVREGKPASEVDLGFRVEV